MNRVRLFFENRIMSRRDADASNSGRGVVRRVGIFLATVVCMLILDAGAFGLTYFSQTSGSPNTLANWNTNRGGGGSSPANFTVGDIFVIQGTGNGGTTPHSMTTTANWTVSGTGGEVQIESGASLSVANTTILQRLTILSGGSASVTGAIGLTVNNGNAGGADLSVAGTLSLSNAGAAFAYAGGATGDFLSGGKFVLARNGGGGGAIPTASWNANSTCEITGITTTVPAGLGQSFGHFTWNCSGQTANLSLGGTPTTVNGTFTMTTTGTGTLQYAAADVTLGIGANFSMTGGTLRVVSGNNNNVIFNISGDFAMSGGTLDMALSGNGGTSSDLNIAGNFTHSAGTITRTDAAPTTNIVFNKTGTQTFTSGGTVSNAINFTVNSGSTLQMAAAGTTVTGAGTFTLSSGATLGIRSTAGITSSGATGNIQVTGTRTFNSGANYLYNGTAAQVTGNGLPSSVAKLTIDNAAGVTLTANTTVTGTPGLALTTGDLTTGSLTLFMGSGATSTGSGDVVGKVNRGDLNGMATRSFGNPNVQITETAGSVTDFTVTLIKGTTSLQTAVQREYVLTPNGGITFAAKVRLRYLSSELNGNSENTGFPCSLELWRETGSTWAAQGSTDCNSTDDNNRWVELTPVTVFSSWAIAGPGAPTACKLVSFTAGRSDEGVVLEWQTGNEVNNVGFNLYKEDQTGKRVRLTPHLVAGSALLVRHGTALTSGLSYSWSDPSTKRGESPRYWIEDLDLSGQSTWNGPIYIDESITPRPPSRGRLSTLGAGRSMMINSLSEQHQEDGAYQASGPVESTEQISKVKLAAAVQQGDLAGKAAVKISVKQEGWYRVTQPQLVAAGLSASVDPKKLQLFVDAQEMPIIVRGDTDGKFDAADSIEFYGQALDTPSTDTRVYWLIAGTPGSRVKKFQGNGGSNAGDSFQYTVQRKDKFYYRSEIQNGDAENFFGEFIYYQPIDQTLNVTQLAPATTAKLEIALQGFNVGAHQVGVSLNGAPVGTLNFNDQVRQVFQLTPPQSLLVEGTNTITLVAQAGNEDFSLVDYIRLTYAHAWRAENNSIKFTAPSNSNVRLGGFTNSAVRVVDVTDPKSPQEVAGSVTPDNQEYAITLTTPGTGTRTLLAFIDSQAKQAAKVAANKLSSWRQSGNQADLVIIGYGDFSSSLQLLKTLRESQGLKTALVEVEDVYDEFSFGQKTPQALKDFLSYARSSWKRAPKYVLLGGTASFDPRNYFGLGETDLVPTKIIPSQHLETASDDWFADFNNDGVPEMAVGRLPARDADESARMVQKVIDYDAAPASGDGVLLVADVNRGFDFEAANDQLHTLVPATTSVQEIRRASDPQAHDHLIEALNEGKKLVNYTGHGSISIWEANLLTTADAQTLQNDKKYSVVVAMTCMNGYYFDERFESLAHALMNAQIGGAVAMWASSALTEPGPQTEADQELFRQLFAAASVRLGDATIKAKSAVTDSDVRRTWILIGDPTTRFKQ